MNNHKEDSARSNPQMNANPDVMTSLVNLAIYYMKRGETDSYRWAKNVLKEVGDEGIRPYLYKAWREAKQVIDKSLLREKRLRQRKLFVPLLP